MKSSRLTHERLIPLALSLVYSNPFVVKVAPERNYYDLISVWRPWPENSLTRCDNQSVLSVSKDTNDSTDVCRPQYRSNRTPADIHFQKYHQIPKPKKMHLILPQVDKNNDKKGILVIGDVHGCFHELLRLHEKAVQENGGLQFQYVILVGDLCNKGPDSTNVIRHVRASPNWLCVRGNHDDGALAAALGDECRQRKARYHWIFGIDKTGSSNTNVLSDEDVLWMANLPYTIRIPAVVLGEEMDTLIVHAGLIPGVLLKDQSIETMITIREVEKDSDSHRFFYCKRSNEDSKERFLWADVWKGPERVIFGHDARRGLQQRKDKWTLGLDTGVVYGKKLMGVILPQRKLVQIDAVKTHKSV
ncbi:predicted protein [Phaeodactylum tricornutum CCAP 1055/1]|jgi:hypothetical protein|uniref:Calcineurin-like phosphoesterase domain-containing protein n=1 Tax=Phaeodactylum tricornutum (strain CCAP 1055/1) TaxID=556484 RepID=B7G322_PHATC|nr:predicted protein [Phaeodactylum tricornutum CCAP 1055/1]EEC46755.1 predicted protein [Phaeodactylum tricornutum CCAP 1055/1]|eukprot:XP_002181541.1 predicted protein [Phaeodactylum tricornutum CCAP 1055/1]